MQLRKVTYQVFECETKGSWSADPSGWHQLDGEIVLTFSDGECEYISWGKGPAQYCIQIKKETFFTPGTLQEIAMSDHPYWKELCGKSILREFLDEQHQVLLVACGEKSVFLSSQYDDGVFLGDCVRVAKKSPL
jgi:hypothetical protein